jgi:hypothetical protein
MAAIAAGFRCFTVPPFQVADDYHIPPAGTALLPSRHGICPLLKDSDILPLISLFWRKNEEI